jgi:hypothetical protein
MNHRFNVTFRLLILLLAGAHSAHAASVNTSGYTNAFGSQPTTADWSSLSIGSAAGTITAPAGLDSAVQAVVASSIVNQLGADATPPPAATAMATWSSSGFYLQTRPTGNDATLLMCTLVNNLGVNAIGANIRYDFTRGATAEDINGHRAYYSLTGAAGSWVLIPEFASANSGTLTAALNITWINGGTLYLLWADDNGPPGPDDGNQIDNFSVTAIPGAELPVAITTQPQSQAVGELQPVTFTVGVSGYPAPTVQWYSNNVAIPGATSTSYNIAATPLSYNGLQFKVIAQNTASNVSYSATSSVATLTVNADTIAPTLVSAFSAGQAAVAVTFSEPVRADTATNLANYVITNASGILQITNAVLASDRTNVTLLTVPQTLGGHYTLIVNGIRDLSAASNQIAPNSVAEFDTVDFTLVNIGAPAVSGTIVNLAGALTMTGAGSDIGGTIDQFAFAYQLRAGDFDVKIRVAELGFSHSLAKAALMAREALTTNSVFAASVATPLLAGAFFESRVTTGANAANTGNFPANYPDMWLRLKRTNNLFIGYAGPDGQKWVQLGSATLNVGSVYLGVGLSSRSSSQLTSAEFADYSAVGTNTEVVTSMQFSTESLSAAERTTPIVISEIMYRPGGTNTNNLEFVEFYNSNPYFEDISGYRLVGDITFTFPSNTIVQGGTFLVVAKDPAALQSAYGISGVLGPYSNSLPAEGTIQLRSDFNSVLLTVEYSDDKPWPPGADGTGHSLVLTRASYGQNDPHSWDASDRIGGSPGRHEPLRMKGGLRAVVINEVLAHTDPPQLDYIELYNYSTQPVDISNCYLSDSASTNKFRVPPNTILAAHGYISFNETQLRFALNHQGETVYFRSADGSQMIDAVEFEAQENGISLGRFPDGAAEFYRLAALTPGTTNALIRVDDVVINEIMYGPISEEDDDEYVELYNKGTSAVDISGWRFTSGIDFRFPPNTILPADGYIVVAKNLDHLLGNYPNLNATNTFGDFDGQLSRNGERVALAKPEIDITTNGLGQPQTNTIYIVVDEVSYRTGGRWGKWANQGGSSLELIDPRANHRLAYNWGDSDETEKAPWTFFEHTGVLDTGNTQAGSPLDRLHVIMLGEGECLLDDVDVRYPGQNNIVVNSSFESGLTGWTPQGNHINSTLENTGFTGNRSLRVRSGGNGDTGANRIRTAIPAVTIGQVLTVKGFLRWQRGWPEITLRIKGGYLEAFGRMLLPPNLGTPGARNSRALTNNAPAIYGVVHTPALPQITEPVVITAGVQDPDGVSSAVVFWRVDGNTPPPFTALAMNDNGTGGDAIARDGIYSATIPAQAAGTMVSFYVEAADTRNATNQFPVAAITPTPDGQRRECLVRWGDPMPVSAFSTYRMWLSRANVNSYVNRPGLSNQDVDGTMIVNNNRPIYNMKSHYSNSPYHQGQNATPESGGQHFTIHLPLDDKYLGTENFNKVHAPGNASFEDNNWIREQSAYWFMRKAGLPYLYRRMVAMYVNGTRKAGGNAGPDALMEDTQRPGGELIDEFFPDETEGRLYKLQPWFEFDDVNVTAGGGAGFDNERWCTMDPNRSTNSVTGPHKIARYRQNWLTRSADKTANDYTNVIALINAANIPTTNPVYWQNLSGLIDVEQWARTFAVQHAVGNWDSFGNRNAQNMYGYKPANGKWKLMTWDFNIVLNNAAGASGAGPGTTSDMPSPTTGANPGSGLSPVGNLFQTQSDQDPVAMRNLNAYPPFRRAWWRAYKDLTVGPNAPMLAANCDPLIDAKYAAFRASGLTPGAPPNSIKGFISVARANIAGAVTAADVNGFTVSTPSVSASASNVVTVSGTATFDVTDIEFNGVSWPITWTSITAWSVTIPVTNSTQLNVVAFNKAGQVIGNTNSVSVNYAAGPAPDPRGFIIFNEIMYNPSPVAPNAEYVELYNMHTNFTFNISGWRVNGLDYTFPEGSYFPPRSFLILARDRVAFNVAYGSGIAVFGQYDGRLQGDGETISLIKLAASTNETDIVIDRVRYESTEPWSVNASGTGSSLQLLDPNQENARVANWFSSFVPAVYCCGSSSPPMTNDGWRFVSVSGSVASGVGGGQMRLMIYLGTELGSALIDDLSLVAGTNPGVGPNFIRNGDFESTPLLENPPLTNSWSIGTNYTNTVIVSDLVHSGNGALKIVASSFGNSFPRIIAQFLSPAPAANSTNTLSFWYWATNSSTNLNVRLQNSSQINIATNINITITPSNYVAPTLVTPATNSLSPGLANQMLTNLPAFAPLWLNEVQAENVTGILDNNGEREPWIEIFNTSTNSVSLEGLYLSLGYSNLTQWAFPAGSSIGPTQFLVVFADGEAGESSGAEYHTSFRLPAVNGALALSRLYQGAPQVLDYINYAGVHADKSFGSYPDGQPFERFEFFYVTPRAANDGRLAPVTVFINEWMAGNTNALADPADGDFDDWFELYNPTANTVDLAGYYLTDVLTNTTKYLITTNGPHTIAPGGYLLVWADNETGQNVSGGVARADRHVNFQLAQAAEAIGLFAPDGTQIDAITFTNQIDDVSEGRCPDGDASIIAMTNSTPRLPNAGCAGGNTAPVLGAIGNKSIYLGQTLAFTATATDSDVPAQQLTFTLDAGAPAGATINAQSGAFTWTPSAAGSANITVRATDNGVPLRSDFETITVQVLAGPNFTSSLRNGNNFEMTWATRAGQRYAIDYKNDLNTPQWTPLVTNTALGLNLSYTNNVLTPPQRFFRIRLVE